MIMWATKVNEFPIRHLRKHLCFQMVVISDEHTLQQLGDCANRCCCHTTYFHFPIALVEPIPGTWPSNPTPQACLPSAHRFTGRAFWQPGSFFASDALYHALLPSRRGLPHCRHFAAAVVLRHCDIRNSQGDVRSRVRCCPHPSLSAPSPGWHS